MKTRNKILSIALTFCLLVLLAAADVLVFAAPVRAEELESAVLSEEVTEAKTDVAEEDVQVIQEEELLLDEPESLETASEEAEQAEKESAEAKHPEQESAEEKEEEVLLSETGIYLSETPAAPVMKSTKSTGNGVLIKWKAVENADSYIVYRWKASAKTWEKIGTSETASYTDTTLPSGSARYYAASAVAGTKESAHDEKGIIGVYLAGIKPNLALKGRAARLSWNAVKGADGYKVYRRVKGASSWDLLKKTEELSYVDRAIKGDTEYEYVVRAVKTVKDKEYIAYLTGKNKVAVKVPVTPSITSCKSTTSGIQIQWSTVDGAAGYKVFRKTQKGSWKKIAYVKTAEYTDKSAEAGTVYYYAAASYFTADYEGLFDRSGTAGVLLATPEITDLKNDNGVQVTWSKTDGADGYIVYRRKIGDTWKKAVIVEAGVTGAKDTEAASGAKYVYMVRAYKNNDGKKLLGTFDKTLKKIIYSLYTPAVKAKPSAEGQITLSWPAVKGASSYNIYRKDHKTGDFELLKATKNTSYIDSGLAAGEVETYSVVAKKGAYISGQDGVSAVYFDAPQMKSASSKADGILVKWNAVNGAQGYQLLRRVVGGKWKEVKKTTSTSFTDPNVEAGKKYVYVVKAYARLGSKYYYGLCDTSKAIKRVYNPPLPTVRKLAQQRLGAVGNTLKAAYDWAVKIPYSSKQPVEKTAGDYAVWSFENEAGDCLGKAAVFCLMARELGYTANLIYGYVPMRAGGMGEHGWVEIVYEGTKYVCDPDFEYETNRNGYFINYGQSGTWMYQKDHVIE